MSRSEVALTPAAGGRLRSSRALPLWGVSGAVLAAGLGAAFTPLLLLVLPALGVALLLGLRGGMDRRAWAALAGAGWLPLWLAWQDRGGPGDVCTGTSAASTCTTVGSPWPWLAAGVVLVVVGLAVATSRRRVPGA